MGTTLKGQWQGQGDGRRDHPADIPAEARDLFDDAGTQIGVFLPRGQEDGFHIIPQGPVHQGHLKFILKIRHCPQPADDDHGPAPGGKGNEQPPEGNYFHRGQTAHAFLDQLDAFTGGKERAFLTIVRDRDDQVVKEFRGPLDDIEMPIGDGIKASRINSGFHKKLTVWHCPVNSPGGKEKSRGKWLLTGR